MGSGAAILTLGRAITSLKLNVALRLCALATVVFAAACSHDPETIERSNMYLGNVVPKTAPNRLVGDFETFCLDQMHRPDRAADQLRAADYVLHPKRKDGFDAYVVDTSGPLIMLKSQQGIYHCAASAAARTGQHNRVTRFMAESYPSADPVSPSGLGLPAERAWLVPGADPTLIYSMRVQEAGDPPRIMLGVIRHRAETRR